MNTIRVIELEIEMIEAVSDKSELELKRAIIRLKQLQRALKFNDQLTFKQNRLLHRIIERNK